MLLPLPTMIGLIFSITMIFMNTKRESRHLTHLVWTSQSELLFHRRLHILSTSNEAGSLVENSVVNMVLQLLGVSKAVLNTDFLPRSRKVT